MHPADLFTTHSLLSPEDQVEASIGSLDQVLAQLNEEPTPPPPSLSPEFRASIRPFDEAEFASEVANQQVRTLIFEEGEVYPERIVGMRLGEPGTVRYVQIESLPPELAEAVLKHLDSK